MDLARRAGLVPCQRGRLGRGREVDGIVRHLQIKRRAGVGLMTDELHGVVGDGDGARGIGVRPVFGLVGTKVAGGVVAGAAVGGVVAQLGRVPVHVPFAEVSRTVCGINRLEHLRDGSGRERHGIVDGAVAGFLELGRCHAKLNSVARRRTDRVGRVGLRECHSCIGEPLEAWRKVKVGTRVSARRDHRHLGVVPSLVVS